jgi:hypothetical protein
MPNHVGSANRYSCRCPRLPECGPRSTNGIGRIGGCGSLASSFPCGVDDFELGSSYEGHFDETEHKGQHEGNNESELDDCAASLGHPIGAPFATEVTFFSTVEKKEGSRSVDVAQMINARAIAAAATMTRAYSAVA